MSLVFIRIIFCIGIVFLTAPFAICLLLTVGESLRDFYKEIVRSRGEHRFDLMITLSLRIGFFFTILSIIMFLINFLHTSSKQ